MTTQAGKPSSVSGGFFVTGTDTGVGKTVVTAALATAFRADRYDVVALKPFATGAAMIQGRRASADALFIERAAASGEPIDVINPVLLDAPLAPSVAARLEEREVDVEAAVEHCKRVAARHQLALIEGIGGLLVPLNEGTLVADFAAELGLPIVIVARPDLGTLNHTALTADCARSRGLPIAGVVINGYPDRPGAAEKTSPAEIKRITGLSILAVLPRIRGLDVKELHDGEWPRLVASIRIERFTAKL